jgi:hypothetical protein
VHPTHVYEIRPRKDKRGFDPIPDALPFCRLWYGGPGSRLLFLAELLEARIVPKRVEHWIEPK